MNTKKPPKIGVGIDKFIQELIEQAENAIKENGKKICSVKIKLDDRPDRKIITDFLNQLGKTNLIEKKFFELTLTPVPTESAYVSFKPSKLIHYLKFIKDDPEQEILKLFKESGRMNFSSSQQENDAGQSTKMIIHFEPDYGFYRERNREKAYSITSDGKGKISFKMLCVLSNMGRMRASVLAKKIGCEMNKISDMRKRINLQFDKCCRIKSEVITYKNGWYEINNQFVIKQA